MDKGTIRLASPLQVDSIVDGPGIRMVLWTQGCIHNCTNCHNPQTHDIHGGQEYSIADIQKQIQEAQLQNGITLSGGEPFLQSSALLEIAKTVKSQKLTIWAYSGFTFEQICKNAEMKALLSYVDILVDGKFKDEEKDYRLVFKGSKNQRIIDVQASLTSGEIVLSNYDEKNQVFD